jgi:peptidoglycan hydrolase FlgJ
MSLSPLGAPTPPFQRSAADDQAKLKKTALQLEGVFVQRMFAAMRDTVPEGGIVEQSGGQSTFTQLLDEKMAEQVPQQWSGAHSLASALYDQLRRQLPATTDTTGSGSPR